MKKIKKNKVTSFSNLIENEIRNNSLRQGFSKGIKKHIEQIRFKKSDVHQDFTHIPFITIDGHDSKDFDDAVWSENTEEKSKIMVAIADVSFFVEENDPVDIEAKKRGNSFYFPDRVIPMLPEELSNDLCSLVPNENRKSIIVEINLINGIFKSFKLHRGEIKSVARLTYTEVERIYLNEDSKNEFYEIVFNLFSSFNIIKEKSRLREKIEFNSDDYEIILKDSDNFQLKKKIKLKSYNLIEEFMVLTNYVIANFLKQNNVSSIFRNHQKPSNEKVKPLKQLIKSLDINYPGNLQSQKDFNKLINIFKKMRKSFLNDFLLKAQNRAFYSAKNEGHFGLSLDNYLHFTSPIRRYSDLIVHRDLINFYFKRTKKISGEISEHLNIQEKKADLIERTILDKACGIYMQRFKKKEFMGFVDAIETFGIFIKAVEYPFSGLFRNRFNKHDNKKFIIGQLVKFKIKKINKFNGKILLERVKNF
jgi:ribonuclease R